MDFWPLKSKTDHDLRLTSHQKRKCVFHTKSMLPVICLHPEMSRGDYFWYEIYTYVLVCLFDEGLVGYTQQALHQFPPRQASYKEVRTLISEPAGSLGDSHAVQTCCLGLRIYLP